MMGNIFAKFKNEVPIAMKYYDQAIAANAMDNISLTNIGYLFLHQNKLEQAKKYFWEALKINNEYPNTHYALGMIAEMENDLHSAFYSTIQSLKLNKSKDELYQKSLQQAFEIAKKISATDVGKRIYREYRHKLEFEGDREIDIVQDSDIPTAAKMEFAENYERPKHLVKYKQSYPAVEHLVMHELVHLDFVIDARKAAVNQLFIATQEHKNKFIKELDPTIKKFRKMGISEKGISDYCSNLFDGLNSQVFNTPIDLFIENFLYQEYAELRPYQFLSLFNMIQEGLKAVTDKKIIELSPAAIISKSKIYNMVNAIQFKELFGMDFIKDFNASKSELTLANDFYKEFLQYKEDKEPAEEYELLLHWAEDLKLDKNFELVGELQYRKRSNIDDFMNALEKDPFGVNEKDPIKEREMKKFQQAQADLGINMAVVMFMVDALQFFEGMPIDEVRKIAYEIAFQGTQGYNPDKKDYKISAIKGKTFSGYHILAYYYVSWSLAVPVSLSELKLPYEEEYKLAKSMHKP